MAVLYVTPPNEAGMVTAITDAQCPECGWPELIIHIEASGDRETGCPDCDYRKGGE